MSRTLSVSPQHRVSGTLSVPGDKSISHRVAMLASVANGSSRITGFAESADCRATLECLRSLGVAIEHSAAEIVIHGKGLRSYKPPASPVLLNADNSGSTIRMLSGILAAQPFVSVIDGDASLRRRPMARIIDPLMRMGASIEAREGNFAPLRITGGDLKPVQYASPTASAQVKTCVLFAGLHAGGTTVFSEPTPSRNHTELMLGEFGARIETESKTSVRVEGGVELRPVDYTVPGDVSSAAFLVAAATLLPDSELVVTAVNLNPKRTGFLDVLRTLGARIEIQNASEQHGERVGNLRVTAASLSAGARGLHQILSV